MCHHRWQQMVILFGLAVLSTSCQPPPSSKTSTTSSNSWTTELTSKGTATGTAIAPDSSGNSILTGYFRGTLEGLEAGEDTDLFVARLSKTNGTLDWIKKLGSSAVDHAQTLAIDRDNMIYIAGNTLGSLDGLRSPTQEDLFVAKLNSEAKLQWVEQWGPQTTSPACSQVSECDRGAASVQDIALDTDDSLYLTGFVWGTLEGNLSSGGYDVFVAKLSTSGTIHWVTLLGSLVNDFGTDITLDTEHYLYVTGSTEGNFEGKTSQGMSDAFVVKLDSKGKLVWTTLIGGMGQDVGTDISVLSDKNLVFVLGETNGSIGTEFAIGNGDIFLAQLDLSGDLKSMELIGTPKAEHAGDLAIISETQIFVLGSSAGNIKQGKISTTTQTEASFVRKQSLVDSKVSFQLHTASEPETAMSLVRTTLKTFTVVGTLQSSFASEKITHPTQVFVWQFSDPDE